MARKAAVTICAANYLARAAVLLRSIARHLPDHDLVLVLAAGQVPAILPPGLPARCRVLTPADIGVDRLELRRLIYDVTEFCTAIKPDAIRYLFGQGFDEVTYFDPDIVLYSALPEVATAWADGADVVLTPHVVSPRRHPDWVTRAVGASGQFNLGFIALRRTTRAREMVDWWAGETALDCIADAGQGRFVDQKPVDFFVSLFPGHQAIRHPGYNVAYWNLHERPLSEMAAGPHAAGQPLRFFHFSGFGLFRDSVSRHLGHFTATAADGGPVLRRLLRAYADALTAEGELGHAGDAYDYDRPHAGAGVPGLATGRPLRRGLRAAALAQATMPADEGLPRDGRIDLETLLRPVRTAAGRRFPRPLPRFLALLAAGGQLPTESAALLDDWIAAPGRERKAALARLLESLHADGTIDPRIAEALADGDAGPPLPSRIGSTALAAPHPVPVEDGRPSIPLPLLLLLIRRLRPDLVAAFPLADRDGVVGFVAWFLAEGHRVHAFPPTLLETLLAALDLPSEAQGQAREPDDTLLASAMRRPHRHAAGMPPLSDAAVIENLLDVDGSSRTPAEAQIAAAWLWGRDAAAVPRVVRLLQASAALRRRLPGAIGGRRVQLQDVDRALRPLGLGRPAPRPAVHGGAGGRDVAIGAFRGVSGIGVSAHGILAVLRQGGRPVAAVDLFDRVEAAAGPAPDLVLFHANADISVDAVVKFHETWASARRRVAYWAWELPCMTRRMAAPAGLFDEIWVPTAFVRQAVMAATDVPVLVVPPLIDPADFLAGDAAGGSFGRSRRGYRFLAVLDVRSYLSRKNPEGAVRAFRMAFPGGDEAAELVVKLGHGHLAPAELSTLHELAAGDARIRILDAILPQAEMNDLYQSADCILSLHRSEGHGLVLVQAMMMGKPVVATAFGGPQDFLHGGNGFPVPWAAIPVQAGAYPDWLGQSWAEPDLQAAALYMRELVRNPAAGIAVGRVARAEMLARMSPPATGKRA